jgi:hypothetical protein
LGHEREIGREKNSSVWMTEKRSYICKVLTDEETVTVLVEGRQNVYSTHQLSFPLLIIEAAQLHLGAERRHFLFN